jgi:hypothetical protein
VRRRCQRFDAEVIRKGLAAHIVEDFVSAQQ